MRALLISDIFPPKTGGSGRWFWEVYRRMPCTEFVVAAGEDPRQIEFDRTHDLPVARLPLLLREWGVCSYAGLKGYTRAFRALRRVVRSARPDCVHAARILPEGVLAWCLKQWFGLPYLCYVHGEDVAGTATSREYRWLGHRVLAGADLVIANSLNSARIVREFQGRDSGKVAVLHPGVDAERFHPAPRSLAARDRLGWGDRPVVLTVGRLQMRKGQDHMIRAVSHIRNSVPDVLYAIMGNGEMRARLEHLVAEEGVGRHVQFMGEPDDDELVTAYQQCDLFVLPNRQVGHDIEGFGMVLLEAQACGKPVIAGASGGTAETMSIPATGRVVDCATPDLLGPLIVEWLVNPRRLERTGAAAREWAVEQFDWSGLTRQAAGLFRRIAPLDASRPAGCNATVPVAARQSDEEVAR
jgi:phosphatidylinositol alpha-1,6-mannosyltransferase